MILTYCRSINTFMTSRAWSNCLFISLGDCYSPALNLILSLCYYCIFFLIHQVWRKFTSCNTLCLVACANAKYTKVRVKKCWNKRFLKWLLAYLGLVNNTINICCRTTMGRSCRTSVVIIILWSYSCHCHYFYTISKRIYVYILMITAV